MFKFFSNIWKTQRSPILFFGFIALIVLLIVYNFSQSQTLTKDWSYNIAKTVNQLEQKLNGLVDSTQQKAAEESNYDLVLNQLEQIDSDITKARQDIANQSNLTSSEAKSLSNYYASYLESLQAVTNKLKTDYELDKTLLADRLIYSNLGQTLKTPVTESNKNRIIRSLIEQLKSGQQISTKSYNEAVNLTNVIQQGQIINYTKSENIKLQKSIQIIEETTKKNTDEILDTSSNRLEDVSAGNVQKIFDEVLAIYGENLPNPAAFKAIQTKDIFTSELSDSKKNLFATIEKINQLK